MIPERLIRILRTSEDIEHGLLPPTAVFNEGWMLRLVLDAIQEINLANHPLKCLAGARWFSEAMLLSRFRARARRDSLSEGFTSADAVLGHFDFRPSTKSGLTLRPDATQFVVVEAKMFSNLSSGTRNAPGFDQAARNVACMAEAIAASGVPLGNFKSIGFFVLAPKFELRRRLNSNLEECLKSESLRMAVEQRIVAYEAQNRPESAELRAWQRENFEPLFDYLVRCNRIALISWEDCIASIGKAAPSTGQELAAFYERCLKLSPDQGEEAGGRTIL